MNKGIRFTDEFKQDAVAQVVERGYAVSEVAERLGISTKSLYAWRSQFAKSPRVRAETSEQAAEIKRLKRELARVSALTNGRIEELTDMIRAARITPKTWHKFLDHFVDDADLATQIKAEEPL
jgi:transposase